VRLALVVILLGSCASMPTTQPTGARTSPVVARTADGRAVTISVEGSHVQHVDPTDGATSSVVVPALTDAHGHVVGLGLSMLRVDLRNCRSPEDCADRVRARRTFRV
jgi:predicted amidohydrolase YtcJ